MSEPSQLHHFSRAVVEGVDRAFLKWAKNFGRELARGKGSFSTVAIRDVFGAIKKLELRMAAHGPQVLSEQDLLLLEPRLAYASQRYRGQLRGLREELAGALSAVAGAQEGQVRAQRFTRLCQGLEAILAYHRAAGGK